MHLLVSSSNELLLFETGSLAIDGIASISHPSILMTSRTVMYQAILIDKKSKFLDSIPQESQSSSGVAEDKQRFFLDVLIS